MVLAVAALMPRARSSSLVAFSRWRQRAWFRALALLQAALVTSSCGIHFGGDDDDSDTIATTTSALVAPPATPPPSTPVDEGQGAFSEQVNNTGAFVYDIDFAVPDAFRGLKPQLKLTYTSQGDVGIAGVGWDLPLPMITIN